MVTHQDPATLLEEALSRFDVEDPKQEADQIIGMCYFEAFQMVLKTLDEEKRNRLRQEIAAGMSDDKAIEWIRENVSPDVFSSAISEVASRRVKKLFSKLST